MSFACASWSTTCDGDRPAAAPLELSALAEHFTLCQSLRGRLFSLRCAAQAMNGFAAARFATTLVVLVLLGGAGSLAI